MMKRVIALICVVVLVSVLMVSCGNKDMFDTVYTYNYAMVSFPDGTVEKIAIKQWSDYEDGEQMQIIANDGTVYLVHSENCILVREK